MTIFLNIPKALIEHLDAAYPEKHPKVTTPDREIWFKAGQRDVVNTLIAIHREQEEGADEGFQPNVFPQRSGTRSSEDRDARPASATGARTPAAPGNRLRG